MNSPTPPTVLLDATFIDALEDPLHPDRGRAVDCYAELLDRYEHGGVRLRARVDDLRPAGRSDVFAPVERIHVAAQHRRAAARLELPVPVSPHVAVTLVLMRREGIRRIATFDRTYTAFELEVVPEV